MKDKRNKRNRVDEEANFIGDVVRLLFALSIAVVTVVAGFILFKNISGFSLPNLKETEVSTEQTKDAVVITEAAKERESRRDNGADGRVQRNGKHKGKHYGRNERKHEGVGDKERKQHCERKRCCRRISHCGNKEGGKHKGGNLFRKGSFRPCCHWRSAEGCGR